MDNQARKALKSNYSDKPVIGGIYCIQCNGNKRLWLKSTTNLAGQQNKFEFAIAINTFPEPAMRAEWAQFGSQSFTFAVLDTLQQSATQTESEFAQDIRVLLQIWQEKLKQDGL